MIRVKIVDIPAPNAHGFRWRWRSDDGRVESQHAFDYYYDCVADAHASGHEVELPRKPPAQARENGVHVPQPCAPTRRDTP